MRGRVAKNEFRWVAGEDILARFSISERRTKLFCSVCGTPILNVDRDDPHTYGLAIATLDDDPGVRNALHLFSASRPEWIEIRDDLPAFDTVPDIRGCVLDILTAAVVVQPVGDSRPVTLSASRLTGIQVGDEIVAHLPHNESEFAISKIRP